MPTPLTMYRTELNGYRENVMNAWKAYQEAIDALGDTQTTDVLQGRRTGSSSNAGCSNHGSTKRGN